VIGNRYWGEEEDGFDDELLDRVKEEHGLLDLFPLLLLHVLVVLLPLLMDALES